MQPVPVVSVKNKGHARITELSDRFRRYVRQLPRKLGDFSFIEIENALFKRSRPCDAFIASVCRECVIESSRIGLLLDWSEFESKVWSANVAHAVCTYLCRSRTDQSNLVLLASRVAFAVELRFCARIRLDWARRRISLLREKRGIGG